MDEKIYIYANNYLRNLHSEIYKLNGNQTTEDFLNFFIKDEVFSIDLISKDKNNIEAYIEELKELFWFNKKIMFVDLDEVVQEWNKMIYLIKREKSLENHYYNIIKFSILSKKFYNEKIGIKEYEINESFYFYDIRSTESIVLITNNHLLLDTELQRRKYIDKCIEYIEGLVSSKHTRKSVPKKIKDDLWIKYFGMENAIGKCYVCGNEIHISKFEAGHVIPYSMGGESTIENLRIICGGCNKSIGQENLYSYKNRHYTNGKNI